MENNQLDGSGNERSNVVRTKIRVHSKGLSIEISIGEGNDKENKEIELKDLRIEQLNTVIKDIEKHKRNLVRNSPRKKVLSRNSIVEISINEKEWNGLIHDSIVEYIKKIIKSKRMHWLDD